MRATLDYELRWPYHLPQLRADAAEAQAQAMESANRTERMNMAIGTIKVWLQGDIDILDAMEKVNTSSGREVHHVKHREFHYDGEKRETWAIYETDCSFAFNCYRCEKLVCVGCSEDNPVLVANEDMVRATCGPCFYDTLLDAKTNAET